MPGPARFAIHTTLPLPSSVRQIDGLQLLRAVAVIIIAWLHGGEKLARYGGRRLPDLGVFGVDIFFVISGFILSSVVMRERRQPGIPVMADFFQRRLLRIYPIYWIFALLAIARLAFSNRLFEQNYIPSFLLLPPLQYPAFPLLHEFSWTLIFEMFFYFVLALILIKTVKLAVPALIAILSLSVIAGALFDIHRPFWITVCNPILLEFVFGALLAWLHRQLGTHRKSGIAMTVTGTALALVWTVYGAHATANGMQMIMVDSGVFERVVTFGIAAFLIVGGVIFWSPSLSSAPGRLFVILGNASYSSYLISGVMNEVTLRTLYRVFGHPVSVAAYAVDNTLYVLLVLATGWLFYNLVEWPLIRALQDRFTRRPAEYTAASTA
jgi:exopolysaccharide production protein ExoZ